MTSIKCECGGEFYFRKYCGCHVCEKCDKHVHLNSSETSISQTLACCFCGWNIHKADPEAMYQEEW